MEKCRKCNTELNEFNWVKSLKERNSKICSPCNLKLGNEWRKENREIANAISLKRYYKDPKKHHLLVDKARKKVRLETIMAYGGKCVNCNIIDTDVLEIDHINNDGAKERKENLFGYNLCRKLKKEGYPKDRYQLLCRNCNWKKELKHRSGLSIIQNN